MRKWIIRLLLIFSFVASGMALITNLKMGKNPIVAQPGNGFTIPYNMHGDVVYISKKQQTEFRLYFGAAILLFGAAYLLAKRWKISSGDIWIN